MALIIDEERARSQSRFTAHRLISMRLRLLELWRSVTGSHDDSLVIMAVVAITGDRLKHTDPASQLRDMANPVPRSLLGKCNTASIAAATGLNREKARRVINRLVERGVLERSPDRSVHFPPGRMQGPNAFKLSRIQLEEFTRTANELLREGVIKFSDDA